MCSTHVARRTKTCIAFKHIYNFSECSVKLCKILEDHDQCIRWCKKHNLLVSSIKCQRENYGNTLTSIRYKTSSRDGYKWRNIEGQKLFDGICRQTQHCFPRFKVITGLICSLICAWSAKIGQHFAANRGSKSARKAELWQIRQGGLNRPFSEILQRGNQGKLAQK